MSKKITLKKISSKLLSRPYWAVDELQNEFQFTEEQFNYYLEQLHEIYEEIGIKLDLIVVNSKDYLVIFIESSQSMLSNLQLGLLVIFSLKLKLQGGFLSDKEMDLFINNYYNEIEYFKQNNLIKLENNSIWSLTPLGASIVFPYLEESYSLVERIILKRNN